MKKRFEEDDELDRLPEDDELDKFLDDEELKKFLEYEYVKEADEMVAALFSEEDDEEYESSDEEVQASYEKLVARMKADGIYRADEADDTVVPDRPAGTGMRMETAAELVPDLDVLSLAAQHSASAVETEKIIPMSAAADAKVRRAGRKRAAQGAFRKVVKYVVACTICLVFVSVSGEAGRNRIVRSVHYLTGNNSWIITDNDENNDRVNINEQEAIGDIEEKLGVEVPEFLYRPYGLVFIDYEVDEYVAIARMEYQYKGNIITLFIDKEDDDSASKIDSLHGVKAETIPISDENINAEVKKIKEEGEKIFNCSAQWKRNGITYHLSGKVEFEEFVKTLQKITY